MQVYTTDWILKNLCLSCLFPKPCLIVYLYFKYKFVINKKLHDVFYQIELWIFSSRMEEISVYLNVLSVLISLNVELLKQVLANAT